MLEDWGGARKTTDWTQPSRNMNDGRKGVGGVVACINMKTAKWINVPSGALLVVRMKARV